MITGPHTSTRYGDTDAVIVIDSLEVLHGALPRRAYQLVGEWATTHREELVANWERARNRKPLQKVEPLN